MTFAEFENNPLLIPCYSLNLAVYKIYQQKQALIMSQNHCSFMFEQPTTISSHCNQPILMQINPNTANNFPPTFQTTMKRQSYLQKKALFVKIQKGQLDHCCIDIVNRKNRSVLIPNKNKTQQPLKNTSNIEMLKKEIQYLEEDNLKWQKFPKRQVDLGASQSISSTQNKKSLTIHLQSLQKLSQSAENNGMIKNFYNTFNETFFISPLPLRSLISSQKRSKTYFGGDKKKPLKNSLTIDSMISTNKQNTFSKTIHSTCSYQNSNRRKYFLVNRNRKNSACTQNSSQLIEIKRKRISTPASFVLQTL